MPYEVPQSISTMESEAGKASHRERHLKPVRKTPEKINRNELLGKAEEIFWDTKSSVYKKFLDAIKKYGTLGDPTGYAEVQSFFVSKLLYLSDSEISPIIEGFNKRFQKFAEDNPEISAKLKEKIREQVRQANGDINGRISENNIKSVIHYIRAAETRLSAGKKEFDFFIDPGLDIGNKIDLIEVEYDPEAEKPTIERMNLVQLKSKRPDDEEIRRIVADHFEWVERKLMSISDFEGSFSRDLPEDLTVANIEEHSDDIHDILLDLCTDPKGFSANVFIDRIGLGQQSQISNRHRAWLLSQYGETLKSAVVESVEGGYVSNDEAKQICQKIDELETDVRRKAGLTENVSTIKTVNSIVAVGQSIISAVKLFEAADRKAQKAFKYN